MFHKAMEKLMPCQDSWLEKLIALIYEYKHDATRTIYAESIVLLALYFVQ